MLPASSYGGFIGALEFRSQCHTFHCGTSAPNMGVLRPADDFSYFLQEKPGAYAWIGNGNSASLHNPSYDFNDEILPIGASFLSRIAEKALGKN